MAGDSAASPVFVAALVALLVAAWLIVATPNADAASTDALSTEVIFMARLIPSGAGGVNYRSVI
jgi:hypothetical protein